MNYIFLGLAVSDFFLILLTALTGYLNRIGNLPEHYHILAGLFTTLFTCLVHCIVFIYFLGTGKSIKTACDEYRLEGDFVRATKKLKARAFPFALFGSLSIMGVALTGGATATGLISNPVHRLTVFSVMAWNALCFLFEYRAIYDNMLLIGRLAQLLPDDA